VNITVPAPFALVSAEGDAAPGGPVVELRNLALAPGASRSFASSRCAHLRPTAQPFGVGEAEQRLQRHRQRLRASASDLQLARGKWAGLPVAAGRCRAQRSDHERRVPAHQRPDLRRGDAATRVGPRRPAAPRHLTAPTRAWRHPRSVARSRPSPGASPPSPGPDSRRRLHAHRVRLGPGTPVVAELPFVIVGRPGELHPTQPAPQTARDSGGNSVAVTSVRAPDHSLLVS
jgi:hypothetical protein